MTRLLTLTLLIGFFVFLPSAFADGDNGLHIIPADVHQSASSGTAMLTLNASNIQVRAKWRLDGDSPFAITDNGELRLTAELSDSTTVVATVIVEDMFSELNRDYQNLAATALITVEFISGTLRIINPPARLLAAFGMGGTMAFQTSGGMGERIFRLYSASDYFTLGETSGILSVAASVAVGQYAITVEVRDETATLSITVIAEVEAADNLILVDAPPLTVTAIAGIALSLHTFMASGGLGTLTYALIGNHEEHFSIDERDGVLRTQSGADVGVYALLVEVSDGAIIPQKATAAAMVNIEIKKTIVPITLQAIISDNPAILHAYNLPYASAYSIVAGNDDGHFAISEIGGTLSVLGRAHEGVHPLGIEITYKYSAGIPPTKLISLVVVEMSFAPPPSKSQIFVLGRNDVWSSGNGSDWTRQRANTEWSGRRDYQAVAHNGKIYVLGGYGYDSNNYLNDVWSSGNGAEWTMETANAGWSRRSGHQAVVYNGKIYVLGGGGYLNDVWSSMDGKTWTKEMAHAGWSDRNNHQAVVHNGKVYVLGGYSGGYYSVLNRGDAWSSGDIKSWALKTRKAGWAGSNEEMWFYEHSSLRTLYYTSSAGRYGHHGVSHNGLLYVLGGRRINHVIDVHVRRGEEEDYVRQNYSDYRDVWSSVNGINWSLETSGADWSMRYKHQALSHNGLLYVLGGYERDESRYGSSSLNDVWSSGNGASWTLETANAEWSNSYQAVIFPLNLVFRGDNEFRILTGYKGAIHTIDAHGNGNYVYSLLSGISGFSLSPNGELSADGTAATGEHTITVQVVDGAGQTATWIGKVIVICPHCKKAAK